MEKFEKTPEDLVADLRAEMGIKDTPKKGEEEVMGQGYENLEEKTHQEFMDMVLRNAELKELDLEEVKKIKISLEKRKNNIWEILNKIMPDTAGLRKNPGRVYIDNATGLTSEDLWTEKIKIEMILSDIDNILKNTE